MKKVYSQTDETKIYAPLSKRNEVSYENLRDRYNCAASDSLDSSPDDEHLTAHCRATESTSNGKENDRAQHDWLTTEDF